MFNNSTNFSICLLTEFDTSFYENVPSPLENYDAAESTSEAQSSLKSTTHSNFLIPNTCLAILLHFYSTHSIQKHLLLLVILLCLRENFIPPQYFGVKESNLMHHCPL